MRTLAGEVGNWVAGERFWGREKELERLLELLAEGANVSIIAQRRIGKTSLMREAGNRLPPDYLVLHIDLQDAKDAADMVVKLVMATRPQARLWTKTTAIFANILQTVLDNIESISAYELEIQLRAGLSGSTWQEKGTQMLSELSKTDRPVVLFVDELPILVNRMLEDANSGKAAVHALLTWLRAQAQAHAGRIRMVFAGSIGLEPVLGRAGLTADINHLTPFLLDPWSVPVATSCLLALAAYKDINLPNEAALRMLELLGCNIPHHVQLFFAQVREHCLYAGQAAIDPAEIDAIFNRRMLGTKGHAELAHMEERLEMVLEKTELPLAMELLTQAAITGSIGREAMQAICARNGLAREEQGRCLPRLFEIFEHDGYLEKNAAGEYVFVSNLLRQWWRARFEAFFETV